MMYCIGDTANYSDQFTRIYFSTSDKRASTRGELVFRQGPVFAQVLLVDEINRATPRTQSALLEAMAERQVTVERETLPLPRPYLSAPRAFFGETLTLAISVE